MKPDHNDEHAEASPRKGIEPLDISDADNAQVEPLIREALNGHCRAVAVAAFVANEASRAKS